MDGSRCSGGSLGPCLGPAPAPPSAAPGLPAAYDFGAPGPANLPSGNVSAGVGGRFESPAYNGIPIDACLTFGRDCGKPAAGASLTSLPGQAAPVVTGMMQWAGGPARL